MKCLIIFVLLTFPCIFVVDSAEINIHSQLDAMAKQIEEMKASHTAEIALLKKEMKEIKSTCTAPIDNHERNEQLTLKWAKEAMNELRNEMKELSESINNSILLQELNDLRNGVQQSLMEKKDLMQLARTQEARLDKLDNEVSRLKHEGQQMRTLIAQQKSHIGKLNKELKYRDMNALTPVTNNDVMVSRPVPNKKKLKHGHKYRHNKMVHTQISRLARSQDDIEEYQQTLQMQLLDLQRRVDRIEESNWNLLSTKVEFLEVQIKTSLEELQNVTQKLSDLDKFHASILELREEIENIENKADKTVPEFRKEISKLDINLAQLNAQTSYLKEDQENLRQSVKAIAVSVSNAIDRAEVDRTTLKSISYSVTDLQNKSKQHSYRLNDHILKSEANFNMSITSSTQEIMEEVKELMPVEREYEDLVNQLPKDCSRVSGPAGVYLIRPGNSVLDAWCDNRTTLIQRRYNGTVDFNRKYADYIRGFGDPNSEYWLGLEAIHLLTSEQCSSMRIDMTDIYGAVWYAEYDHFSVGNAEKGYVLDVSGFKGNASDAFDYQNHMEFSAIDHDRDISNTHCAGNYEGGWWFSHCQHVNLNGKYNLGLTWFDSVRNEWIAVATSEIRTFRRPGCP